MQQRRPFPFVEQNYPWHSCGQKNPVICHCGLLLPPKSKAEGSPSRKTLTFSVTQTEQQQFNSDASGSSPGTSTAQGRILISFFLKKKLAKLSTMVTVCF